MSWALMAAKRGERGVLLAFERDANTDEMSPSFLSRFRTGGGFDEEAGGKVSVSWSGGIREKARRRTGAWRRSRIGLSIVIVERIIHIVEETMLQYTYTC